jgi:hypothetical protein
MSKKTTPVPQAVNATTEAGDYAAVLIDQHDSRESTRRDARTAMLDGRIALAQHFEKAAAGPGRFTLPDGTTVTRL